MIDIDALDTTEAATLPIKTQWRLVHYWRDTGQFERAHALIDEHVGRNGQTITNVMERARVAQAEGDTVAALRYARERYGLRASVPATNALIRAEIAAGNLARARDLISELEKSGAEGPSVLRLRAEIERRAGNLDLAESLLRRSVHSDYSSPDTYLGLAAVALALGDIAAAREHLDLLLTDPATLDYRHQREAGLLFEQMGDTDRASQLRDQANEALRSVKEQLGREVDSRLGAFVTLGDDAVDFSDAIVDANESSGPELDSTIVAPLKQVFGFDGLRPGQASVISRVMSAIDTLAIMPTGSGKSLTFQLPALLLPGVTIVISPLIALMKDQVDSLPEELRRRTRLINSTLSPDEMERALDELISGALKLVYVAPERLRDRAFLQAIRQTHVSLAVIDEAHCISLWGQDFRPDYLFIPRAVKEMGEPPVLAVTATATPDMARHIAEALRRTMDLCRVSLFRPNLFYEVRQAGSREFKIREMVDICRNLEGSGIVYVNSRKDTESFAAILRSNGVNALHYHAGLEPGLRASHQDRFMSGQVRVVVATIAFGMGVDKANVRFIIHFNPPASLEAYAQESGRAGRDGEIARCILLATRTDETRLKTFSRQDVVTKDDLRVVYTNLKRRATGRWVLLDRNDANRLAGDAHEGVNSRVALGLLEQAQLINRHPDVPRTINASWNAVDREGDTRDERWLRLASWLGADANRGRVVIDIASTCNALGWTPFELDEVLESQPDIVLRDGPRLTCLELLDSSGDAAQRVDALLANVDSQAERRIHQVIAYTKQRRCRHQMLAAQFGERLSPCQRSCDVCTGDSRSAAIAPERGSSVSKPALSGPDAAMAIIDAVRTLPFPVGRTGLVRLVLGSAESRIQGDRSASFGVLSGMKKGAVDKLVDRLVELGYLFRDMSHEYLLISLTDKGKRTTREELAGQFMSVRAIANFDSEADEALLSRLTEWRTERASRDGVPAYVVAHNTMLSAIAVHKPQSLSELESVPGFGPVKTATYGPEILRILDT